MIFTAATLERILARIPALRIGVLGDLFLDRYLDLDAGLTEPSLETGLDAYQVVRVRSVPGAAGTVINNLVALGVGHILPITVIGDDGEGYELRQALASQPVVDQARILVDPQRRTPTYTKPMLHEAGKLPRELNRLDIKNRVPLSNELRQAVERALREVFPTLDALLVLDQVSEPDCGVVTESLFPLLEKLGRENPRRIMLADSRERIHGFRGIGLKPNERECLRACDRLGMKSGTLEASARHLAQVVDRPVFCTRGELGMLVIDPRAEAFQAVPAFPVSGPIDPVGAGDSTSAGLACALAGGASLGEAGAFANLVASVTVQQLGTTGTASPAQLRQRWREVEGVWSS